MSPTATNMCATSSRTSGSEASCSRSTIRRRTRSSPLVPSELVEDVGLPGQGAHHAKTRLEVIVAVEIAGDLAIRAKRAIEIPLVSQRRSLFKSIVGPEGHSSQPTGRFQMRQPAQVPGVTRLGAGIPTATPALQCEGAVRPPPRSRDTNRAVVVLLEELTAGRHASGVVARASRPSIPAPTPAVHQADDDEHDDHREADPFENAHAPIVVRR